MVKVGLVTVLYNSNDVLDDFFKSISIQSYKNYHLYLIDNSASAETDALIAQLIVKYPLVAYTHIKNPENYGVAKGNNQGITLALNSNAGYVLLLNNDIAFTQEFLLDEIIKCAILKEEHIIIPKIYYYGSRKIWLAGGEFIHYKGTSRTIGDMQEDTGQYNKAGYTNYAPTCFMLISKEVFDKIGLMDENYFVYYDDNDFVIRAIRQSFKIYYMPSLEVFHKVSFSTGGAESLFSIYYLNRNRIYFIRKHYAFFFRCIALSHMGLTKGVRYLQYDAARKKTLLKSVRDGFNMQVEK